MVQYYYTQDALTFKHFNEDRQKSVNTYLRL